MLNKNLSHPAAENKPKYLNPLTDGDQHIIVELQIGRQSYYGERALTYVSRLISKLAEKGARKYAIPPIYSINLLNFRMKVFHNESYFKWEVQLKDQTNRIFLPQIKFIFIELCTFARLFRNEEYRDALHRWLYIIKNMGDESVQECPFDEPIYLDFFQQGEINKLTTMEKEDYAKSIFDYQDVKDTIEFERECARAEGEAKGLVATAKKMLELNFDIATIAQITGLSEAEIGKL